MAGNKGPTEAGSVYLGVKLNDEEFLRQISQLSKEASRHLQKQVTEGLKIGPGNFGLDKIRKDMQTMSKELSHLVKDQTGAIDHLSDFLQQRMSEGFKSAIDDSQTKMRQMARTISTVKLPKIKAEHDADSLEALADNLGAQLDHADAKARMAKKEMLGAQEALKEAQNSFMQMSKMAHPGKAQGELLQGFNAEPFNRAIDEATEKYLKLDKAAQDLGLKLQAVVSEQEKLKNSAAEKKMAMGLQQGKEAASAFQKTLKESYSGINLIGREIDKTRSLIGSIKMPKLSENSSETELKQFASNLQYQIGMIDKQRELAKNSFNTIISDMNKAKAQFLQTQQSLFPEKSASELMSGFNVAPFTAALNNAELKMFKLNNVGQQLKSTLIDTNKAQKQMSQGAKALSKNISHVGKSSISAGRGLKKMVRMGMAMFGIRTLLGGVRRLALSVGDSFRRMVADNIGLANSLNGLAAASDQMKGAFAAMAAPLVQTLAPALQTIIDLAIQAFNAMARLIGGLLGFKTVQVAVGSTKQFTQNLGGAAGAAGKARKETEKLKRTLAGFDELEVLKFNNIDDSAGSGGGGGGGIGFDPGVQFAETETFGTKFHDGFKKMLAMISDSKPWKMLSRASVKAFNTIKGSAEKALNRVFESWNNFGPQLIGNLVSLGSKAAEAIAGWASYIWIPFKAGSKAAMIDVAGIIGSELIQIGAEISGLADAFFGPFLDSINLFWDDYGETISNKIYDTWNMISEGLGLVLEGIANVFHETFGGLTEWFGLHGDEIKTLFSETWTTIWGIIEPIWNTMEQIGKEIFGRLAQFFYTISPSIKNVLVNYVDIAWKKIKVIWEAMLFTAQVIFGALKTFWEMWGQNIMNHFAYVWDIIKEKFSVALDFLALTFSLFSNLFSGNWEALWEDVKAIGTRLWDGLTKIFKLKMNIITNILSALGVDVDELIKGVKDVFNGLLSFVKGVFTRDWKRAWQGVISIFEGIWKGVKAIFISPINHIITAMNWFIRQLNRIRIPSFVPIIGGQGFNIPEMSPIALARGGIVEQPTLSLIGEAGKEAVMPLERNTGWIDYLADKLHERGGVGAGDQETHVTIPVYIGEGNLMDVIEVYFDRQGRVRNKPVFS